VETAEIKSGLDLIKKDDDGRIGIARTDHTIENSKVEKHGEIHSCETWEPVGVGSREAVGGSHEIIKGGRRVCDGMEVRDESVSFKHFVFRPGSSNSHLKHSREAGGG
jgi:hypothetical protein